jgi:thiol-disulfide isomerase/thioredoxin
MMMKSVANASKTCIRVCKKNPVMTSIVVIMVIVLVVVAVYGDKIGVYEKYTNHEKHPSDKALPQTVQLVKESERKSKVQVDEGFSTNVQSESDLIPVGGKKTVALFHANWCGYCKKFMPHFESAMAELNGNSDMNLVLVDHDQNEGLSKKYDVSGFPTVVLISPDGSHKPIDCPRDATFVECLKKL